MTGDGGYPMNPERYQIGGGPIPEGWEQCSDDCSESGTWGATGPRGNYDRQHRSWSLSPSHHVVIHEKVTQMKGFRAPKVEAGYRDLADIFNEERERIERATNGLLGVLDIDHKGQYWETYRGMAEFYIANLILLHERNEMAHDAWRRTGWAGNLMTLWGKAMRLMHGLWWSPGSDVRREKPLDHAGDLATYAGFFAILWQAGDERGSER